MAIKSFITRLKWKDGVKKATDVIIAMNIHSWQAAGFQMAFFPKCQEPLIHCCDFLCEL